MDDILQGGFPAGHLYLVEGHPGAGKTTLALQFLLAGVQNHEPVLYVTLSETRQELAVVAESHGWTLDGVDICELTSQDALRPDEQYTVFHPSEVELNDTSRALFEQFDRVKPNRVVFDSLSELRLLAREPLRYRRQILALKQYFAGRGTTVLLLDDRTGQDDHQQLQSISHGVLALESVPPEFGSARRRLTVIKLRGCKYREGIHDYVIDTGGLRVFPRIAAAQRRESGSLLETVSTGVAGLDELMGGGIDRATSTLIMGPAGSGKSSLGIKVAATAAERGESSVIFTFDETIHTVLARSRSLGVELERHIANGLVRLEPRDPAEVSPGEFMQDIADAVDRGCKVVMIDSLNGFIQAMPGEKFVLIQLHELLTYLNLRGVITILILAQYGLVGGRVDAPIEISYLADSVLLLRYFELAGMVRRAISAVKRRVGQHEQTIREMHLRPNSITIGQPITSLTGILSGTLSFTGRTTDIMKTDGQ